MAATTRALRTRNRWLLFVLMTVIVVLVNLPIITMILNSFKTTNVILTQPGIIPREPTLVNYTYLATRTNFPRFFLNSFIVAGTGTLICIVAATLGGYVLSRFTVMRPVTAYSRFLLMMQMFPLLLALIPLFILFRNLGLTNSFWSVILIYSVAQLPFSTWMFKAFFDSVPRELEEAAQIDGCSRPMAFRYVVLPLSGPAMAAVTIFAFLFSYNEYLIANVFLKRTEMMTVPVGIQMFIQQFSSDWGNLMAASTMAMVPTFILFLFVQRYMIYAAIGSAVKG
jgi:ABC-type glycerol-3-phosphate transport system permease component